MGGGASGPGGSGAGQVSLGDLRTIDPCGRYPPVSFEPRAYTSPDTQQLEVRVTPADCTDCAIAVTLAGTTGIVDITSMINTGADLSKLDPGKYAITSQGQLKIVKSKAQADQQCEEEIVLPDQTAVDITAKPRNSNASGADFCGFADLAAADARTAMDHGVRHLPAYPAISAGSIDICSLASTATASAALGRSGMTPQPGPGHHSCDYGLSNGPVGNWAYLSTDLTDLALAPDPQSGMTESTTGSRGPARSTNSRLCRRIRHRPTRPSSTSRFPCRPPAAWIRCAGQRSRSPAPPGLSCLRHPDLERTPR
jgi:hypothetical protein